jgi:hypothetical protein
VTKGLGPPTPQSTKLMRKEASSSVRQKSRLDSDLTGGWGGRVPKATTWSSFYDGANGSRRPGDWPMLLQRAWGMRANESTEPLPLGPDNMQSRGARASQYSS